MLIVYELVLSLLSVTTTVIVFPPSSKLIYGEAAPLGTVFPSNFIVALES